MISVKCYAITKWVSPVRYIPLLISSFSVFLRTDWRMRLSDLWRMSSRGLFPMFSLSSGRRCPPLKQTPHEIKQRSSSGSWMDGILGQGFLQLQLDREQQGRRMEQANLAITEYSQTLKNMALLQGLKSLRVFPHFCYQPLCFLSFKASNFFIKPGSCSFFWQNKDDMNFLRHRWFWKPVILLCLLSRGKYNFPLELCMHKV